jgi:murein DD-endopeptidase MepM/ murein hydrolase activator NlpD
MGWNQAFNGWHLAQDFKLDQGLPVYAIADGEVVLSGTDVGGYGLGGTPGGALVARFKTSAGESFTALYGHINNLHKEGNVEAGQILGYTNGYDHLHFGIHPGYELAENPWSGYTHNESETYGWVDPVQFLLSNTARAASDFPSFLILPLFMLATLLAIVIYKKILLTRNPAHARAPR